VVDPAGHGVGVVLQEVDEPGSGDQPDQGVQPAHGEPDHPAIVEPTPPATEPAVAATVTADPVPAELGDAFAEPVLAEPGVDPERVTRLILCSGKLYYELVGHDRRAESPQVAIGRVELLYPFPQAEILALISQYPQLRDVLWVQEEPRNMGARAHMSQRLRQILPEELDFGYVGRPERASPGEGYPVAHALEQERIIATALDLGSRISQFPLTQPGER